ncbi:FadR family transcriptional regulator [Amycolatopsis acidicola]|uniref:FadR family transcriptional regulator n=1 Tax=Amycolatopsis acidicola TaxID=2596893 RepID=A0A5N0V3G1_9PSEU|nr:FCD domain-containing protein [Amycolatopsis acidicola]KAA9160926.1 FadR family transcriptional regulator [Amycolatopsis acidicola]
MNPSARPKKTALLVAERIVEDIHRRGNQAGDKLPPERVMLEEYDVGRGTLRESLRFLELQGVLTLKPGPSGGPIVQHPDPGALTTSLRLLLQFQQAPFQTVIEARVALEPSMARLAAERMDEEEAKELAEVVRVEREQLNDQSAFRAQTREFHMRIAQGSGNAIFGMLFTALFDILDGNGSGVDYPLKQRKLTVDIHEAIATAIAAGDREEAERLMKEQMLALLTFLKKRHSRMLTEPITWKD